MNALAVIIAAALSLVAAAARANPYILPTLMPRAGSGGGSGSGSSSGCGGTTVGGACWYYGNDNQSCTSVCATHGGYDAATLTYAGSSGTLAQCDAVLVALGAGTGSTVDDCQSATSVGCMTRFGVRKRCASTSTTEGAAQIDYRRACACNS
jgi:hypothetical protein